MSIVSQDSFDDMVTKSFNPETHQLPPRAPAPRNRRKKIDYFKWASAVAVPIIVAAITMVNKGENKKTPTDFNYAHNISVFVNQYQHFMGQPLAKGQLDQLVSAINLAQNGEYQSSRQILESLAGAVPVPAVFNMIGAFYAEKGDMDAARQLFDEALAKDGSYKPAVENLARLKASPLPTPGPDKISGRESEPNNDIAHANIIRVGPVIAGEISNSSDTDFYQFTTGGAPRDIYRITMNPAPSLRPDIHVYDAKRNDMFEEYRGTGGAVLEKDFSPIPDTVYYVQIAPYDNSGSYTLSVKPLHAYDSFEPNDDILSAKPIALGKTIEANIMDTSDTDFYQVKSGSAPNLTLVMNPATSLRPDIHVYDAQRNHMFEDYRDTGGAILERKFDVQPNTVYYVQVAPYDNAGRYSLTVK
jgi:hypothetical protein